MHFVLSIIFKHLLYDKVRILRKNICISCFVQNLKLSKNMQFGTDAIIHLAKKKYEFGSIAYLNACKYLLSLYISQ